MVPVQRDENLYWISQAPFLSHLKVDGHDSVFGEFALFQFFDLTPSTY